MNNSLLHTIRPGDIEAMSTTIALLDRLRITMLRHQAICGPSCALSGQEHYQAITHSGRTLRTLRDSHDRYMSRVAPLIDVGGIVIERPVALGTREQEVPID